MGKHFQILGVPIFSERALSTASALKPSLICLPGYSNPGMPGLAGLDTPGSPRLGKPGQGCPGRLGLVAKLHRFLNLCSVHDMSLMLLSFQRCLMTLVFVLRCETQFKRKSTPAANFKGKKTIQNIFVMDLYCC